MAIRKGEYYDHFMTTSGRIFECTRPKKFISNIQRDCRNERKHSYMKKIRSNDTITTSCKIGSKKQYTQDPT